MEKNDSKKVGELRETANYSRFKTHTTNRVINNNKVKRLMSLMIMYGWLPGSYVVVDKNFVIIDGQHRFVAAQILGIAIWYIQLDIVATPELIRLLNSEHTNWALEDTLHGFVEEGSPEYIKLNEFKEKHPELKFTDVMMIAKLSTRSAYREELEKGNFKMRDPKRSEEWAEKINMFAPYVPDYNSRSFVRTLVLLIDNPELNFNELMGKVKKNPGMIKNYKLVDRNLEMFEKIYNKGRRKENRISLRKL